MHSKLQGLAKPSRLSMPRPAGECPRAVSSEPQAGRVAWKKGKKLTGQGPLRVYLRDRGLNGRPRAAAGSTTHHLREATGERPEKSGKFRRRGKGRTRGTKGLGGRRRTREKAQTPNAAWGSIGWSTSWTAMTENQRRRVGNGRGPAPEVSCNPQPSIHDHHSRFGKKLTAWNCVEVVVRSKLQAFI